MGCLDPQSVDFGHWFGNIHLSGGYCNRSCFFCIGQHMMALDGIDVLDTDPLPGLDTFVATCVRRDVREVNVTATNTDPLLYRHTASLRRRLERALPGLRLGVRTNAVVLDEKLFSLYDTGSATICSLDPVIYRQMMGRGVPPRLERLLAVTAHFEPPLKVNVVLGRESIGADLEATLAGLERAGVRRVNLREPYGQPRVGDPLAARGDQPVESRYGQPVYRHGMLDVTYWDVHRARVNSINLYASGRVSSVYAVTLGHAPNGEVAPQETFPGGRLRGQWLGRARIRASKAPAATQAP